MPERDVVLDLLCRGLGIWVEPRAILADLALDDHVVIAGQALPWANRVCLALGKILALDALRRKVIIAFNLDGLAALGDHRSIPNSLRHSVLLPVFAFFT